MIADTDYQTTALTETKQSSQLTVIETNTTDYSSKSSAIGKAITAIDIAF